MSKKTDVEIKDLIITLDKKIDSLTQKADLIDESVKKQDTRLWGLILPEGCGMSESHAASARG